MDISKKYAKYLEGLEFVRNRGIVAIGPGYNVLNRTSMSSIPIKK